MTEPVAVDQKFKAARKLIEYWALLGSALLLGVVLVTAWSLFRDILWNQPVSGENEIVQVGIAVAVFSFLPYCQMTGANISADIFTARLGARAIALLTLLGSLVALIFASILVWRTWAGLFDYREYLETTPIMQFPIWIAFIPILISIVFLLLASAISILEAIDDYRTGRERAPMLL